MRKGVKIKNERKGVRGAGISFADSEDLWFPSTSFVP
jgi:hypothetical protein